MGKKKTWGDWVFNTDYPVNELPAQETLNFDIFKTRDKIPNGSLPKPIKSK